MSKELKAAIEVLRDDLETLPVEAALRHIAALFPGAVTFSTSFSAEDQAITHFVAAANAAIKIFTLDTGRLFDETYAVWEDTNARFNTNIEAYYPEAQAIERYVKENGPNAFYNSVENRKECCYIRKVAPLKRALYGNSVWITGLRAGQSPSRQDMSLLEWDEANGIIKYNPLLDWPAEAVWAYIKAHDIPYSKLYDKGFESIGCAPCTRAIAKGEDPRAGRWWWEDNTKKECGLHIK